jgi:hypothetical protein
MAALLQLWAPGASVHRPELTLDQILADPIIRAVMQRDGVSEARVRELMEGVRRSRHARPTALVGGSVPNPAISITALGACSSQSRPPAG